MRITVAGSGWSGAIVAHRLAEAGHAVDVYERRDHVGGNCYTERQHGVMVHRYGPHIFHTDDDEVWRWVQQWSDFVPYRLKVRSTSRGQVFTMPVNLDTINQVHRQTWTAEQARAHIGAATDTDPETFEEAAIATVGEDIYHRLFRGYTAKQWGIDPAELPASVFRRLPVRFDRDDNYFTHRHQAMPVNGYTSIFARLLDHPLITVHLGTPSPRNGDHVFWTGPLDAWFEHSVGRLRYRTLRFTWSTIAGPGQGVALMNWPDEDVPWTRVTDHRHLAPWESTPMSVVSTETPADAGPDDEPFYPLRLARDRTLLDQYVDLAEQETGVTFLGRLGTYRYLDMDVTIREALDVADRFLDGDVRPFYAAI